MGEARVSVVAFADYPAAWGAGLRSPGINYTPVSLEAEHFNEVAHRAPVIVDDMISTGGTVERLVRAKRRAEGEPLIPGVTE